MTSQETIVGLDLSERAETCLNDAGIRLIEELILFTEEDLSSIPGVGGATRHEIRMALRRHGFRLADACDLSSTEITLLCNALQCLMEEENRCNLTFNQHDKCKHLLDLLPKSIVEVRKKTSIPW